MRKIILIFLLFGGLCAAGQTRTAFNNLDVVESAILRQAKFQPAIDSLHQRIDSIEQFILNNEEQVELMAVLEGTTKAILLPDREWPEHVSVAINILRSADGKLKYYAEYPTSESGDWFIGYEYFIDSSTEAVYAFRRTANFFNNGCTSGVAKEYAIYYFSPQKELIAKSYSLQDKEGIDLSDQNCIFPYDYKYTILLDINELGY